MAWRIKKKQFGGFLEDAGNLLLDATAGSVTSAVTGRNISDFTGYEYNDPSLGRGVNTARDIVSTAAPIAGNIVAPGLGTGLQATQGISNNAFQGIDMQESAFTNDPNAAAGLNAASQLGSIGTSFIGGNPLAFLSGASATPNLPQARYGGMFNSVDSSNKLYDINIGDMTHEEHPNGGYRVGDHSIEGNEVTVNFDEGSYVFSNRLKYAKKK